MNAVYYSQKIPFIIENFNPNRLGIYISLFIHLIILLFAIGLPDLFKPKTIFLPNIIPIEIINVTDTTFITEKKNINNNELNFEKTTPIKQKEIKNVNEHIEDKPLKQKKFSASKNVEIKKVMIQKKPEIPKKEIIDAVQNKEIINVTEKKAIAIKEKTEIQKIETEKFEQINNVKIIESLKISKQKLKPKPKPKPKPKKIIGNKINTDLQIIPKPQPKPEPVFSIASMVIDLRNEKLNLEKNIEGKDKQKKASNINNKENKKDLKDSQLSISEMDLILQQLKSCFNPNAGTIINKDEIVKITAKIDRNAKVVRNTVRILDTNIDISNPYYNSITESAMRTLHHPDCLKLKLPKEKYETWKNLTIKFDYSWMKN